MKTIRYVADYRKVRKPLYPDVGDQLDAIWKILSSLPETQQNAIFKQIQQVKTRVPKDVK